MSRNVASARLKELLQELAQSGSPVDLSVVTEAENPKIEIKQSGGVIESYLSELEDGRVACSVYIGVTNQTSRTIDVVDVQLHAIWNPSPFEWVTPCQVNSQGRAGRKNAYSVYRFPGKYEPELAYDDVINHVLLERKRLPAGRLKEGFLLAIGGRMPVDLCHGQMQDLDLTIFGADHAEYSTTLSLWTQRPPVRKTSVKGRPSTLAESAVGEALLAPDFNRLESERRTT